MVEFVFYLHRPENELQLQQEEMGWGMNKLRLELTGMHTTIYEVDIQQGPTA